MSKRILITGSRDWSDMPAILNALLKHAKAGEDVTLVHGGCPTGADAIANEAALFLGWKIEKHEAQWGIFGKSAGPKRNQRMVDLGADVVLAFPLGKSKGTRGTIKMADEAGLTVINYGE